MIWIVYCTTCLITGKIYIGVHKTENPNVFDGYYGNGISKGYILKNPKTPFQRALKKYGYANFKRCTLREFDNEDEAYQMEALLVTKDFIKRHDNYNISVGGKSSGTTYKWIYRYRLDGSFWEEYFGVNEIAEKLGTTALSLREACNYKRSYKNSFWSFDKEEQLDLKEYRINKLEHTIYQFTKDGEFVKEWNSVDDICKTFETTKANVYSGLYKKSLVKDYYFLHDKNVIFDILKSKSFIKSVNIGEKIKVLQYDLNGVFIKEWGSVKECAKVYSKCKDVAKGLRKQTKGYIFKYKS